MSQPETKALFCFLDVETTGKNKYKDELWSCSYQIDLIKLKQEPIYGNASKYEIELDTDLKEYILFHNRIASPWVINNTKYSKYFNYKCEPCRIKEDTQYWEQLEFIQEFLRNLEKQKQLNNCKIFLVGANPAFDNCFLER